MLLEQKHFKHQTPGCFDRQQQKMIFPKAVIKHHELPTVVLNAHCISILIWSLYIHVGQSKEKNPEMWT